MTIRAATIRAATIRVVVADDQTLVRAGVRAMLEVAPDIEVVGEAGDGAEAVRVVTAARPDVVLMDLRMPGTDGIEATRRIVGLGDPGVRVLVVTTFDLDEYVYEALRAGAAGFLLKDSEPEDLQVAVRTVHAGHALFAPSITQRLVGSFAAPAPAPMTARDAGLTSREGEVVRLVARGLSNSEIARELVVAESTVKTHVSSALAKLGLRDRVQLVVFAYENGLFTRERSGPVGDG